ncbi:MAG TPA: mechanosensitive ion channel family protein [Flavobacteriia bacterium]|nr:mechanosensitive ion channel family protein [Flavobacteriia bacterium]
MIKKILSILLFLFYGILFSQVVEKVDLSNPNATVYTHFHFLQQNNYHPEKSAKTIYGLEGKEAIDKAIKLKKIFEGRGLKPDFSKIPTNPNYTDTIVFNIRHKYVLFPVKLPKVYVEKYGDKWYYSKETVSLIDSIYKETFPWQIQWLQKWIPNKIGDKVFLGFSLWIYFGFILLVISLVVFFLILNKVVFFILHKTYTFIIKYISLNIKVNLKKIARPIVLLILIGFIKRIIPSFHFNIEVNNIIFTALDFAKILLWIYIFLRLARLSMAIYAEYTKRTHAKLDDQLVPILTHFLTGIILFFGVLKLLTLFGVSPQSVIAGASIGGIALALASQDTVKNLIGTFMIFLDKPFHIGDWIETSELQGTVEEVGFRSSRIRAADTSVYQITNSKLSEIVINNKGMRLYRRYRTELGIRYDTPPEYIEIFVDGLKKIIQAHPATNKEQYDVAFSGFGDSALKILVNTYFSVEDWSSEQIAKHELHLAIVKLAKIIGVDFAFPSSTLMIEQFPEKQPIRLDYNKDLEAIKIEIQHLATQLSENKIDKP